MLPTLKKFPTFNSKPSTAPRFHQIDPRMWSTLEVVPPAVRSVRAFTDIDHKAVWKWAGALEVRGILLINGCNCLAFRLWVSFWQILFFRKLDSDHYNCRPRSASKRWINPVFIYFAWQSAVIFRCSLYWTRRTGLNVRYEIEKGLRAV